MVKHISIALLIAAGVSMTAQAQENRLANKPIYTLGEAKTWTGTDGNSYTFDTDALAKIVQTDPVNTSNVFLYPENGAINTEESRAKGMQGFYIDMEASVAVGSVTSTWEGASAAAYNIYLTDTEPTLAILDTTPTYTASGLGQYQENTAVLPAGSKGRYLVFQGTEATNWGWGVKIRSMQAYAPVQDELTTFTASPALVLAGTETAMTFTCLNQLGLDIDGVDIKVSDNATLNGNVLTVNGGERVTFTATYNDITLTAEAYVVNQAPGAPAAADIKTPIFTNTVTDYNDKAGFMVAYNGGAIDKGRVTFDNGEVAQLFLDTRCVFFYNSETTGAWNGAINPAESGYSELRLSIFAAADRDGYVEFEGTDGIIEHTQPFALKAGQWNDIAINVMGETRLANMSVRFNADNMCDILLANIYFTPAFVEGDETAPVFGEVSATASSSSVTLSMTATDDLSTAIYYTITDGTKTWSTQGTSGETTVYTIEGLKSGTEYTFDITASDGKNIAAETKHITVTTQAMPSAPEFTLSPVNVEAIFSTDPRFRDEDSSYDPAAIPAFDAWGSAAVASVERTSNGSEVLFISNYVGQWGGLVNLFYDLAENVTTLHIDIYTETAGTINIAPVWEGAIQAGADTPSKTVTLETGWNSIDEPMSTFEFGKYGYRMSQFALTGSTVAAIAIDNLLAYNPDEALTGVVETVVSADDTVNVYNMQGVMVRANVIRTEATVDLPAGLYIVGGAKVLVR